MSLCIAPPERLPILWFDIIDDPYKRMLNLKDIPECIALELIDLMQSKGFRFVQLGSSDISYLKANQ